MRRDRVQSYSTNDEHNQEEEEAVEEAPSGELDISEMDLAALDAEAEALGLDLSEPLAEEEEE